MSTPVAGVLSSLSAWAIIHLRGLPEGAGVQRAGSPFPTFDLAPSGVYTAALSPGRWWALTPPFHPYLWSTFPGDPSAVCFLLHWPAGRPDLPLASTLPYGAPSFLDLAAAIAQCTR